MIEDYLKMCTLCPHECKVNRLENNTGRCRAGKNVKLGLTQVHKFEEPYYYYLSILINECDQYILLIVQFDYQKH